MTVRSWRDRILSEFTPQVARLTLVADPDGLLLEDSILAEIRERGFEIVLFEDHISFRYVYESKFRSRWDLGEELELVVVLRSPQSDLNVLPYDLLDTSRKLSFNLGELFPNLSYPVVAALDRADFDTLYRLYETHMPRLLGDNATKEFVLRHVFEIAPELIKQPTDLLRVLLRRHYRRQQIPAILDKHLIRLLRQNNLFCDWPLEAIIPDRNAFLTFLQERWNAFLDRISMADEQFAPEYRTSYDFQLDGPIDLPFDHDDVRVYIHNLFWEGLLRPVSHAHAETLVKTWASVGVVVSPEEYRLRRIQELIDAIESEIPTTEARHGEWIEFASRWAELITLTLQLDTNLLEELQERLNRLRSRIDSAFTSWVLRRYVDLINLPPVHPVMVHHIPRLLARSIEEDSHGKVAFLLVDGLSLDQWVVLREVLLEKEPKLRFNETAVFAWIPTVTSVSRQAAFAGKPPLYFPSSIYSTHKEPALWNQFWVDHGLQQHEVEYAKGLDNDNLDQISELLERPGLRVLGLVMDKVDRIMHGMQLGAAGMHNQVRQWARQGFMLKLFGLLHEMDFQVYLASDHGNVEATGCGRPAEGAIADLRGERVRIYSDPILRTQVKTQFPESLEWPPNGLPADYLALIAPHRTAFVRQQERIVGHGGITIEELVVPLVQIERGKK